jgi:transposase, IS5 family
MKPRRLNHDQGELFRERLSEQLNPRHELLQLSGYIHWEELEGLFENLFEEKGRPGKPTRLVVGLLMLQHLFRLSDEFTVSRWIENPYWQLFCGYDYLQWEFPLDPSSLVRWRKRLGKEGLEQILIQTIQAARKAKAVGQASFSRVTVDTTVMEKNITYPTDAKLYERARQRLVSLAKLHEVPLRQNYSRVSKRALLMSSRYIHARQMKRARKQIKKLKIYLGRVVRDIERKIAGDQELTAYFSDLLGIAQRILSQEKTSSNKVYSVHEPDVECIAKGKARKKYEFGCKVSLVVTHREGLVLNSEALHGNPYDGHTLKAAIDGAERFSGYPIHEVFVDKGYRGHNVEGVEVYLSGRRKGLTLHYQKLLKRRQAIEPHIGHMKSDGKLGLNYLRGQLGDLLNALLAGIGHNLRLILNSLRRADSLKPSYSG